MAGIKVTWDDQQRINAFGRHTGRKRELETHLEELAEELRTLEDASSEVTLADEAPRLRLGDCFVEVTADEAEAFLETRQTEVQAQTEAAHAELAQLKSALAELKVELVGKFGDAIALDNKK